MDRSIRLIVADLDGTLLNSNHALQPFTAAAIDAAIEQDVLFTVATGKTFPSTSEVIRRFKIAIPVICGNGTQVFLPDGSLLHEDPIPLDHAVKAIRMAQDQDFTAIVYTREGLLTDRRDENVAELVSYHEPEPTIVPDVIQALLNGRYNVSYDDIRALAYPVLRHRILLNFHAEAERVTATQVIDRLLETVPEPASGVR